MNFTQNTKTGPSLINNKIDAKIFCPNMIVN